MHQHEALDLNSRSRKPSKKVLDEIRIKEAENGGHIVKHHFVYNSGPGPSHEPEEHVFGEGDGHKMLAHVANVMHVKEPAEAELRAEDEPEGDHDSAAGAATS